MRKAFERKSAPAMTTLLAEPPSAKPLLRGVLHQVAFFVSLVAMAALIRFAPTMRAAIAAAIYGTSLSLLYGVSALYHRPTWPPSIRQHLRRLDHAMIFVLIAGSYTPVFFVPPFS